MNSKAIRKQLLAAVAMVLVAAVALGSSTYAWFANNSKVTAEGLKATAQTGSSALLIAENKDSITDNDFKTSVQLSTNAKKLAPVSTVDGKIFFWNKGTNVAGDGDAINDTYEVYDVTEFQKDYPTAVGYIEYDLLLKATLSGASPINLTELGLEYSKASDNQNAFRVAFFASEACTSADAASEKEVTLVSIMNNNKGSTANFDAGKAVNSKTTIGDVSNAGADAIVTSSSPVGTKYYHVIVRMWIEGEDDTCRTEVFNPLDGEWALKLAFEASNTAAVKVYTATETA